MASPQSAAGPDLAGLDEVGAEDPEITDRNETFVDSLSQVGTNAYFVDLYGSSDGVDMAIVGTDSMNIDRNSRNVAVSSTASDSGKFTGALASHGRSGH